MWAHTRGMGLKPRDEMKWGLQGLGLELPVGWNSLCRRKAAASNRQEPVRSVCAHPLYRTELPKRAEAGVRSLCVLMVGTGTPFPHLKHFT